MTKTEKIVYFEEKGVNNTEDVLSLVKERAEQLGIKSIVIASTRGETGAKAAKMFKDYNLVVVTHSSSFRESDGQELTSENRERILKAGGKILTTTHALGGIGRAIRRKLNTYQYDEIIANTLRLFGQGTKVAVEIALMAADSGLVSIQEDLISVGGSNKGADTALILHPATTQDFFNIKIQKILCKPLL